MAGSPPPSSSSSSQGQSASTCQAEAEPAPELQIAVQSPELGLQFLNRDEFLQRAEHPMPSHPSEPACFMYSPCGQFAASASPSCVDVFDTSSLRVVATLPTEEVTAMHFSPLGTYLLTWKRVPQKGDEKNVKLWLVRTGDVLLELRWVSLNVWPCLHWHANESICIRATANGLLFYEVPQFSEPIHRLVVENLSDFWTCTGRDDILQIAVLNRKKKGIPSTIKFYQYPEFGSEVVSKSMLADQFQVMYNSLGSAALILYQNDVDTSGESYYGDSHLHFVCTDGSKSMGVPLLKNGPILDAQWNPMGKEFMVIHGVMPPKVVAYNLDAEPYFDFGTIPRNTVRWNPHGKFVCIAGFGNMPGKMDFWEKKRNKFIKMGSAEAPGSAVYEWSPDGRLFLTGVVFPRMRVDNGYSIWKYTGEQLNKVPVREMRDVSWKPIHKTKFKPRAASPGAYSTAKEKEEKPNVYIPPWARGKEEDFLASRKMDEDGPKKLARGRNVNRSLASGSSSIHSNEDEGPSKRSRNRRRKNKKTNGTGSNGDEGVEVGSSTASSSRADGSGDSKQGTGMAVPARRVANIRKRLHEIERLEEERKGGATLNKSQLSKIERRSELEVELNSLVEQGAL